MDIDQPNRDAMGELREEFIRSLSLSQLEDINAKGEMVIENEADRLLALVEAYAQRRVEEKLKEYQDYLLDDADAMIPNAYIRRAYAYFVRDQLNQTTEDKT